MDDVTEKDLFVSSKKGLALFEKVLKEEFILMLLSSHPTTTDLVYYEPSYLRQVSHTTTALVCGPALGM